MNQSKAIRSLFSNKVFTMLDRTPKQGTCLYVVTGYEAKLQLICSCLMVSSSWCRFLPFNQCPVPWDVLYSMTVVVSVHLRIYIWNYPLGAEISVNISRECQNYEAQPSGGNKTKRDEQQIRTTPRTTNIEELQQGNRLETVSRKTTGGFNHQGPVVQSVVSLTSS